MQKGGSFATNHVCMQQVTIPIVLCLLSNLVGFIRPVNKLVSNCSPIHRLSLVGASVRRWKHLGVSKKKRVS